MRRNHIFQFGSLLLMLFIVLGMTNPANAQPSAIPCGPNAQPGLCAPPFQRGDQLMIRAGIPFVWLRELPGSYSRVSTTIWPSNGPVLQVISYPPVWDGYQWWYFVSPIGDTLIFGWVEQASLSAGTPIITPTPIAPPKANWSVPMAASLKSSLPFGWIRAYPSSYAGIRGTFYPGAVFTVMSTPAASFDGVQWWWPIQIQVPGTLISGWLEQGSIVPTSAVPTPVSGPVITTPAAFQTFERGFMIWTGNDQQIYVLSGTTSGTWSGFPLSTYVNLPDNPVIDPAPMGLIKPVRGFGRVWGNDTTVRLTLGWALKSEVGYTATITIPASSPLAMGVLTQITLPDGRIAKLSSNGQWSF